MVYQLSYKNIKEFLDNVEKFKEKLTEEEKKLKQGKDELEKLKIRERDYEIIKLRMNSLNEKTDSKKDIMSSQLKLKKEIGEINLKKSKLFKDIEDFKDVDKVYEKEKSGLEEVQEKLKATEIQRVSLDKEIVYVNDIMMDLKKEIKEKLKIKVTKRKSK